MNTSPCGGHTFVPSAFHHLLLLHPLPHLPLSLSLLPSSLFPRSPFSSLLPISLCLLPSFSPPLPFLPLSSPSPPFFRSVQEPSGPGAIGRSKHPPSCGTRMGSLGQFRQRSFFEDDYDTSKQEVGETGLVPKLSYMEDSGLSLL